MRWLTLFSIAGLGILLLPEPGWAWGPATHIFVGTEILGAAAALLPAALAKLIRLRPYDFLYGCIAADITFGKKYAPVDRHCHHWHVGEELYDAADCSATRACAIGYLTHLAGDTIAHNFFLPRKLLTSANTQMIGHSYWEHRMDVHLGEPYLRAARHLITEFDHRHNDELFDQVLARAVFSFQTNRRIFNGMIRLANHNTWQAVFDRVIDYSRWDVDDAEVVVWMRHTFDFAADYLIQRENSVPRRLDPTGEQNLLEAKRLRRQVGLRKSQRRGELEKLADERFPLPERPGNWWELRDLDADVRHELFPPLEERAMRRGRRRADRSRKKAGRL